RAQSGATVPPPCGRVPLSLASAAGNRPLGTRPLARPQPWRAPGARGRATRPPPAGRLEPAGVSRRARLVEATPVQDGALGGEHTARLALGSLRPPEAPDPATARRVRRSRRRVARVPARARRRR